MASKLESRIQEIQIMMNRYCWLPAGGKDTASSRLRCYYLHEYFIENGIYSKIGYSKSSNVSIIQKRLDYKALFFSYFSWRDDSKIILDIDDLNPDNFDWVIRIKLFANIVDGITASTGEQLQIIKDQLSNKQKDSISFFPIEDTIDYSADIKKIKNIERAGNDKKTVCWFGNSGTFNIQDEAKIILKFGFRFLIISDKNPMKDNEGVDFMVWNQLNFPVDLVSNSDICIFSHFGNNVTMAKSANKMVASIALGIPVIASTTPAYTRVAELCGFFDLLYSDIQNLQLILKKISNNSRRGDYMCVARSCIVDKFSVASIGSELNEWCKKIQINRKKHIINYILATFYFLFSGLYNKIIFLWKK